MIRELFYNPVFCTGCGECIGVCPVKAHSMSNGMHLFDRGFCIACLKCIETCYSGALEGVGDETSIEQILTEVEKDRVFYEESGGGLTVSGGEPMLQFEFSRDLLRSSHSAGIHTCMETCGLAPSEHYIEILPYVDLFLWDIKDTDSDNHKLITGAPLEPIIENLRRVDEAGGETFLRCILVSGINLSRSHLDGLAEIFHSLSNCIGLEFLPYHELGNSKCEKLGMEADSHPSWAVDTEALIAACEHMKERWNIEPIVSIGIEL